MDKLTLTLNGSGGEGGSSSDGTAYIGSAYSPTVEIEEIEGGHRITTTHMTPQGIVPQSFDVMDGITGLQGPQGLTGPRGDKGEQGEAGQRGERGETGPQGEAGPTGSAAGFGELSATIGTSQGTPTVTVTATGPNTQKAMHFAFDGLKGETGPKGEKGDKGDPADPSSIGTTQLADGAVTRDKLSSDLLTALTNEQIDAMFA